MQLGIRSIVCLVFFALIVSGADVPECNPSIILRQVEGIEAHAGEYFGLFVIGADVKAVQIRDASGLSPEYLDLDPMAGGYWAINVPAERIPLKLPLTVVLISPTDEHLKLFEIIQAWDDNAEINTNQCFKNQQPPEDPCPQTITLHQMDQVEPMYFALKILGATEPIKKVELQDPFLRVSDVTWWLNMPPMAGGYWAINAPRALGLPMSVRLTSASGRVLVFEKVITEFAPNTDVPTKLCFEIAPPPPDYCQAAGLCDPAITLRQADGVEPFYFGLSVLCASEKIVKVKIHDYTFMTPWLELEPMAWGGWAINAPRALIPPLTVQLTSASGRVLTLERKIYMFLSNKYVFTKDCFDPMPVS